MLISSILAVTAGMCVAKRYIDVAVMPYIIRQGGHKKKEKKLVEGQKKQSTWDILKYVAAAKIIHEIGGCYTLWLWLRLQHVWGHAAPFVGCTCILLCSVVSCNT